MCSNVIETIKSLKTNPEYKESCESIIESILILIHYQVEFKETAKLKTQYHINHKLQTEKYYEVKTYIHMQSEINRLQHQISIETDHISKQLKQVDLEYQQSNLETLKRKFQETHNQTIDQIQTELEYAKEYAANYELEYLTLNEHVKNSISQTKTEIDKLLQTINTETNHNLNYILDNFKRKFLLFDVVDLSIDTNLYYYRKNGSQK